MYKKRGLTAYKGIMLLAERLSSISQLHYIPTGILISLSCCLATNGKDGRVLKHEKAGPTFSSFNAIMPAKNTIKVIMV